MSEDPGREHVWYSRFGDGEIEMKRLTAVAVFLMLGVALMGQVSGCGDDAETNSGQVDDPHYTDNGNGTVTDDDTGLTWQQEDDNVSKDWDDAIDYCQGLVLAGYTDWYLPDIDELDSIIDESRTYPAINTDFFPGTNSNYYWSSSTCPAPTWAYCVSFGDGYVVSWYKTGTGFVRCVR